MIPSVNPETGVRYGVIAIGSLKPELAEELMYGPYSVDVDYETDFEAAEERAEAEATGIFEAAEVAADEVDPDMSDQERESFIEQHLERAYVALGVIDADDLVAQRLEEFSDKYVNETPTISGTYEDVEYRVEWHKDAPHLYVLKGPEGGARTLCDPAVSTAANLDSGFEVGATLGHACYVVPKSWLATPTE